MKIRKAHIYSIVSGIILALVIIFFGSGYRIEDFKVVRAGSIELSIPHKGSVIYLNNKEYKTTKIDNQTVKISGLPKRTQSIIVAKQGKWPWAKEVYTNRNYKHEFSVWNIDEVSSMEIVNKDTALYAEKSSLIASQKLPSEELPLYSSDRKMSLYVKNSTVYVTWYGDAQSVPSLFCDEKMACKRTVSLISLAKNVSGIFFYPNTNDRIIISSEGYVSALEIAKEGNQNFQYITLSPNPTITLDENTLYIKDGEAMGKLVLQ